MSTRRQQKEATRQKVLAAARAQFDSVGYEAATVREIARIAGVSVGSVFTTFRSKAEILSQVMEERLSDFYAELDHMAPRRRGSTADRLRSLFAIHYGFEATSPRLFLAHIQAAFDWTSPPGARPYGAHPRIRAVIADCLREGAARGDVDPAVDIEQAVELLLAAYAWTYRLAAAEAAEPEQLSDAMDRQVGLIVGGLAPRVANRP